MNEALARLHGFLAENAMPPTGFIIGAALCRLMDANGECSPTREEIGRLAGIQRIPTISSAVGKLVEIGFITRERGQRGVRYRLRHDAGRTENVMPEETPVAVVAAPVPVESQSSPSVVGEAKGNATNIRDAAITIVRRFRERVRRAALDADMPLVVAVVRIREILKDGVTESALVRAVDNAAAYFAGTDEGQRIGLRRFLSGQDGGAWKEFLAMEPKPDGAGAKD